MAAFLVMDCETGADRRCGHHGCGCVVSPGNPSPSCGLPHENCLLMDDTVKQTGEECMVVVQGDRVIAPEQEDA